jgi:uncharacterized membrane protein YhaH (DUF805 family)
MVVWKDRASRSEFWWFFLYQILASMAVSGLIVFGLFTYMIENPDMAQAFGQKAIPQAAQLPLEFWVFTIGWNVLHFFMFFLPSLSVTVRRLHDSGHSGWWYWIVLIPLIGIIILLVLLLLPSDRGQNRFGPNPRGVQPFQPLGYRAPAPKRGWGQPKAATPTPQQLQAAQREDFREYYRSVVEPAIKRAKPGTQA